MRFTQFISESLDLNKSWECYHKLEIDSTMRGTIEYKVSKTATENVIATIGRDIHHKADDQYFHAEKSDKEWLSSWVSNVEFILSDRYYSKALAFFKKYNITP